jgi:hypothetical protein
MSPEEAAILVTAGVGLASAVATATPNQSDNKILQFIFTLVNILGMNFGQARNK